MAKIYMEVLGDGDDDEPVTMSKEGDPFRLLSDARHLLRKVGVDRVAHVTLCLCKLCGEDE